MEPTPVLTQTTNPGSKLPWILAFLLLLVVVGVSGFLIGKAAAEPPLVPVETKIETKTEVDESEWNIYVDPKNTFVFSYPKTVTLNGDSKVEGGLNLYVRTKDLKNYTDEPMGYDLDTALQDQESLKNNQTGYLYGGIPDSAKLVTFSGINGKTFVTVSLLEVCDVRFDRSMVIYKDNQQILLGLSVADSRSLANKIPQYFTKDSIDCGDALIWKSASRLVADLMTNAAPQPVQSWYDTFDQILATFRFTKNSNDVKIKTDIQQILYALEIYRADNKYYPTKLDDLVPNYLAVMPKDLNTNKNYTYQVADNKLDFIVSAVLEDKTMYTVSSPKN